MQNITLTEFQILDCVWSLETKRKTVRTVKQIMQELENLGHKHKAYTTVKTLADKLVKKNILRRSFIGERTQFSAGNYSSKVSKNTYRKRILSNLSKTLFDGNVSEMLDFISHKIKSKKAVKHG